MCWQAGARAWTEGEPWTEWNLREHREAEVGHKQVDSKYIDTMSVNGKYIDKSLETHYPLEASAVLCGGCIDELSQNM